MSTLLDLAERCEKTADLSDGARNLLAAMDKNRDFSFSPAFAGHAAYDPIREAAGKRGLRAQGAGRVGGLLLRKLQVRGLVEWHLRFGEFKSWHITPKGAATIRALAAKDRS